MRKMGYLPFVALLLSAAGAPLETRELFVVKEFPALKVMVPEDKSAWCGPTANISIIGESGDQFIQNAAIIQRIIGGVRAVMSFECPEATKLKLTGKVQGQPIYQAFASATNNWILEGAEIRSADQLKLLADMETVAQCDELGGSPDDPEAMISGISDADLNGPNVVDVCGRAVAIDADTPRLKYQYARGLLKAGRDEEALEQLIPAAEAGHGGALALLGDIHLAGAAGVEVDPAAARSLYEKAAAAQFKPANTMLARFEDQTDVLAQAEAEERQAAQAAAAERAQAARPRPAQSSGVRLKCSVNLTLATPTGQPIDYDFIEFTIRYDKSTNSVFFLSGMAPTHKGKGMFLLDKRYETFEGVNNSAKFSGEPLGSYIEVNQVNLFPNGKIIIGQLFGEGTGFFAGLQNLYIRGDGDCV